MQQAIKLLQLSHLELVEEINQEIEQNPILEATQTSDEPDEAGESDPEPEKAEKYSEEFAEVRVKEKIGDDIDWDNYLGEYSSTPTTTNMYEMPMEAPSYENFISAATTLTDHMMWQWRMAEVSPKEMEIGIQIIGNLNSDGYLKASTEEIAAIEEAPLADVEKVLSLIQELDPIGIAARDLRECLLLQLNYLGLGDSLAARIVREHLLELEKKNYQKIARNLKVAMETVFAAERVIVNLEPRPGRQFSSDDPQYISPDVFVYKLGRDYVVVLNEDGLPRLRVSQYYKEMLSDSRDGGRTGQGLHPDQVAVGHVVDPEHPSKAAHHLPGDGVHYQVSAGVPGQGGRVFKAPGFKGCGRGCGTARINHQPG